MKKRQPLDTIEVKCDACGGTGSQPAQEPEAGRRIYPGRCKKCDGKGRIAQDS
jgi:hypothetical protein